jgi:hypothetical protein
MGTWGSGVAQDDTVNFNLVLAAALPESPRRARRCCRCPSQTRTGFTPCALPENVPRHPMMSVA